MNKFKRKLGFLSVLLVVILSIQGIPEINNNIIPKAAATSATLHVTSQDTKGNIITGFYQVLQQAGTTVATGFTPVDFTLDTSLQYTLAARGFGSYVFDHWLDTGSTVNPRPVSITTNTQLTAVYRITAISLNPTSGPAGTTVTVSGSGFAANSGITISYDGAAMTTNPGTITTDSTGAFSGSITVPLSSAAGPHMVKATDASNHPASASFTVTTGTPAAAISLNPTSGPTGTTVNISGSNFAANSGITISYDNAGIATTPTTITTTSTGSFTGSITIPSSSIAGSHTVKATDASANSASAQFTVTTTPVPAISLNPTSGPTGTTVNISGSNFAANSGITISYDNAGIATTPTTITTTSTGSFTGSITIPSSSAAGTHTVKATDASANSASASFTVTTGTITPTISLNPSSGPVGTTVTVSGSGFASNSGISITYGGTAITTNPTTITTDSTGSFAGSITVTPSSLGTHTVKATDASSNSASAQFTVTPAISLSPSSGSAGTSVTVTGNSFSPSSHVTISFDGTRVSTTPGKIKTDGSGKFSASFTVPTSSAAGPHTVKAADALSNSASASFTVTTGTITPSISLNPTSGPTGTTVNISGSNFAANSGITISYDNAGIATTPTTITTTSTGSFTGSITIPSSSIAGSHTVKATDASANSASAQFTVTTTPVPAISLNPTSGPTGTTVNISCSNFAANYGITISYDNAGLATTPPTITTTSTGSFTGSITIPSSSAAGTHTVKATDGSANSASASFTVTTAPATPTISLNPSSGPVGTTVTDSGSAFASNSGISITYGGTAIITNPTTITTDSTGSFAGSITVPP